MNKIYLSLLIFCATLCQAIGDSSEKSIDNSSALHIRIKRLTDKISNTNAPTSIRTIPYIVNIHENGKPICGGTILSPKIILTAAHCVEDLGKKFTVLSGSKSRYGGVPHNVSNVQLHPLFNSKVSTNHDLAMLAITPPINLFFSSNKQIQLYNGPLRAGTLGTVSGWGCTDVVEQKHVFPTELRSIKVPVLNQETCNKIYTKLGIGSQVFCTGDGVKGSCLGDSGSPFSVNGYLVGIMSFNAGDFAGRRRPDVFVNLMNPPYRNWIISTKQYFEKLSGPPRRSRPRQFFHRIGSVFH